jgi:hypothetical protein
MPVKGWNVEAISIMKNDCVLSVNILEVWILLIVWVEEINR